MKKKYLKILERIERKIDFLFSVLGIERKLEDFNREKIIKIPENKKWRK